MVAISALADEFGPANIISGDRLTLNGKLFCLKGIDAPDKGQKCVLRNREYDCSHISKTALMDLTIGARVHCSAVKDDKACTIADCSVDGFGLSANMVHTGWALALPKTGQRLLKIQASAKAAKRGLWRGTFEPPWEWRKRHGK